MKNTYDLKAVEKSFKPGDSVLASIVHKTKISHLSQHQKDDICTLLSTYEQIFGDVPQPCRGVEHDILLIDNAMPVKQHPYRVNPCKRNALRSEVEFLLQNGLAEQSTSDLFYVGQV
ncbi:hypothetical protein Pmani_012796 [Petrolisthes manimaculis]|uniref:Reverse transcriptase n=1 Tax=Petrolisthes manimaculis TaxID=1843537 RepID=A0AAE1PZS0_9EUCA|nr:hypothetical protein Pmani_012796 [Petrolisthes manimaculis]